MKKINRFLLGSLTALMALIMVGCHYNENPMRTSLNIDTSVLVLDLGQSVTRKASSKASGAVFTYTSSNPGVAGVTEDGTVYAISKGQCIITVSMAEDKEDWYAAAKVQYKVIVDDFISQVPESAKGPAPTPVPDPNGNTEDASKPYEPYIPLPPMPTPTVTPVEYLLDIDYDNVSIGQVICLDDGNIARNYDVDKVPSGSIKVAMIAYLGTIDGYCANGLAISLNHKSEMRVDEARIAWARQTVPVFSNAGWELPNTTAYYKMFIACGGKSNQYRTEDDLQSRDDPWIRVDDAGFIEKLTAAGVDQIDLNLNWTETYIGMNRAYTYMMSNYFYGVSAISKQRSLGVLIF